ncbi:hypothetical protein SUGI_0223380 [Cryptomeria japonica]|nr:hypothetical protein SUGI_0223380 [Cryptomeria japonica]
MVVVSWIGYNKGEYGGWDDFDRSNALRSKNGILGDWLQNWENDRGKSLLVMGFGVVFAWSVARPRALWWVCLPLCGFMLLLFFHDYTTQDESSRSRSRSTATPNSNKTSSEQDGIRIKSSLTNQFAILYDVMLNFLSLDKSAQETLSVHNDISFGDLWQYLKTIKAAVSKSNKSTESESSSKEFKLEPQIWRRILEEDGLDGAGVSDPKLGYAVSKSSPVVAGAKDITLRKSERQRKSSESRTKELITNGYSQQSLVAELGQGKLNGRKTHSGPVQSAHGQEREINIVDLERSRKGDNNQGEEWRRKVRSQNSDESASEEPSTTNCGYERDQRPHKDGSVSLQLGSSKRSEEFGLEGQKSSSNYRGMISQSAEHQDEEYAGQQRFDVLHNYTRGNSQAVNNHVNVPMPSSGINERVKNPLTTSAAGNEGIVIEHGLLQTDKSSSFFLDGTNILQTSLHLSEASMIEEPRISTQDGSHERRGNVNDRYGEQNGVTEKKSLVDNSDSDCYTQAAVSRRKVAANSSQSEHSETPKAQDLPFSENVKEFFQMCLDKGGALLKDAKKGLQGKSEVVDAEGMLYEAAVIFSTASALDPSSLVAVGQWGNTLLVHGEFKLKLSQELRSLLQSRNYSLSKKAQRYQPDELRLAMMDRDTIAETLHQVCEECDKLLVEAGRKYRKALLLDKYDLRSLYNWGLALCFRAQLFSGGGERALKTADKIYLAAIDKFEAVMGISETYAPDALFSWGLALRNRSHMRTIGSKERIRLLQQARQLFEDALKFNPNHGQAKTAAVSCIDELKELELCTFLTSTCAN